MINKVYKNKDVAREMHNYFMENGFIQLSEALDNSAKLRVEIEKLDFKENYDPLSHKKKSADTSKIFSLEIIKIIEYLKSNEFLDYIEKVTSLEVDFESIEINKFSHRDFIILTDSSLEKTNYIEVIIDLSDEWKEEFGGTQTYTTREEEVLYMHPTNNSLTIIYKPEEVMKYLKYINNKAKDREILRIEAKYQIDD